MAHGEAELRSGGSIFSWIMFVKLLARVVCVNIFPMLLSYEVRERVSKYHHVFGSGSRAVRRGFSKEIRVEKWLRSSEVGGGVNDSIDVFRC